MITDMRKSQLLSAAEMLLHARRDASPIDDLPAECQATSLDEAYFVQDVMAYRIEGEQDSGVHSWKIGAPAPDAVPLFAPMISDWIKENGSLLDESRHRLRGLEAEIAFLIGKDLPPRSSPYTRDEVVRAIASCHPAIEELESAFTDPAKVARFTMFSDMQIHGGFVYGPAIAHWQQIDFAKESVAISVDGAVRVERTASNTAGTDLLRLVLYLANEGSARTGGLQRGSWITTGSWTGNTLGSARSNVDVQFSTAGHVSLRFA